MRVDFQNFPEKPQDQFKAVYETYKNGTMNELMHISIVLFIHSGDYKIYNFAANVGCISFKMSF